MRVRYTLQLSFEMEVTEIWEDDCPLSQIRKQALDSIRNYEFQYKKGATGPYKINVVPQLKSVAILPEGQSSAIEEEPIAASN